MAVIKTKPTSPGRRFVVKVVDEGFIKGGHLGGSSPLRNVREEETIMGVLRSDTAEEVTSSTIELLTGRGPRMGYHLLWNV